MKLISACTKKSTLFSAILLGVMLVTGLSACSNTTKEKTNTVQTENSQRVDFGKVVSVRTIQIQAENTYRRPYGNVGVSASSGGFGGIYGSIDLATIGGLFNNKNNPETAQEIIIKKNNGETIAITQKSSENFNQGDAIKIVIRNGIAQVIH